MEQSPPTGITCINKAFLIDSVPTDFCINIFNNTIFIIITQINKVGTLYQCHTDTNPDGRSTYTTQVILGDRDNENINIIARQLLEKLCTYTKYKTLLIGISLKNECTFNLIRAIINAFDLLELNL